MHEQKVKQNSFKALFLAARPKTLGAIICPIFVATGFSYREDCFLPLYFLLILLSSICLQIAANLINDYCDFQRGADTSLRLGPKRAMQMGWVTHYFLKANIFLFLFLAILLGIPLVIKSGTVILLLGVLSIIVCIWYSYGPMPLSYLGFSEIFVFCFFGVFPVLGTYYIQCNKVSFPLLLASIAPGFMSVTLIMINNLRDIEEDTRQQKKTLAVRFNEGFSRKIILTLMFCAFAATLMLAVWQKNYFLIVPSLLPLLFLRHSKRVLYGPIDASLNALLAFTGKVLYGYGLLFFLACVYG